MDIAVVRRERTTYSLPPVVLISASPGQDILSGRWGAPRGPVISFVTEIALTILYFGGLLFFCELFCFVFFPSTFSSSFVLFFISFSQKPWRRGRDKCFDCGNGVQESGCPVLFSTLTLIMGAILPVHTVLSWPLLSAFYLSNPFFFSLCLHSTPFCPKGTVVSLKNQKLFGQTLAEMPALSRTSCMMSQLSASVSLL